MARRASRVVVVEYTYPELTPREEVIARSNEYFGPCEVRHLPAGVSGSDLDATRREKIQPGQIWQRGKQRVRITSVVGFDVRFIELTPPHARRRMARSLFLRTSLRESS